MCTCICLLQHKLRYINFEALCTPTKPRNHIPCLCHYNCKALLQSTQKADYKVLLFWGLHRVEKTNGPTPAKLLLHFHCCHCQLIAPVNKPAILQLQSTGTDSCYFLLATKEKDDCCLLGIHHTRRLDWKNQLTMAYAPHPSINAPLVRIMQTPSAAYYN
jgi:hypothetical protein